jgi:hypothetical protein
MKRYIAKILGLLFLMILLTPASPSAHARSPKANSLQEINLGLSGQTLKDWYQAQSGNTGHADYFGAYITLPVEDQLYIGLTSARAAENSGDGSYFAVFDGTNLAGIAEPNEQGLHKMIYDGSLIHIAGTDPHPDDQTAGNHYTYNVSNGAFTKYRDSVNGLIDIYHTWGLWKSGSILYATTSGHIEGDGPSIGQVFASADNGATWTKKANLVDAYRAYDIIGFNNALYALHTEAFDSPYSLSKSTDGGVTWNVIAPLASSLHRVHMIEFNNMLLMVSYDRTKFYALDSSDNITTYSLPNRYLVGASYEGETYIDYNLMVVGGNYLYLIAEKQAANRQAVLRTFNLQRWDKMDETREKLISLSYWPAMDWLVAATPGTEAKLLKLDLSEE